MQEDFVIFIFTFVIADVMFQNFIYNPKSNNKHRTVIYSEPSYY